MPGGRLTQQERQQIALGLADDLAYAEIARRLDRPTSTVTREVMRNGGPTGYRADLAHRATEHRAHRRTAPSRDPHPADRPGDGRDPGAIGAFEESITTVFMQSGLSRMPARVLAALLTTDSGSLTAGELAQRLQVSPASVSKAVAFLDEQSMVRRERDERRRERYVVDDEIWYQSAVASAHANSAVAAAARRGVPLLGSSSPAGTRLENVARFLDHLSEMLLRAAEQGRDVLLAKPAPEPGTAAAVADAADAADGRG
ncbi:MAG: helix-turn-helix domain-containing protein [Kitasatospora sp.]|jgi:DNA-directed RNA polymerase specialized sigma24 family protein|nr:helix-turn-helix domain-containing protein [Kitasatospora sp.]